MLRPFWSNLATFATVWQWNIVIHFQTCNFRERLWRLLPTRRHNGRPSVLDVATMESFQLSRDTRGIAGGRIAFVPSVHWLPSDRGLWLHRWRWEGNKLRKRLRPNRKAFVYWVRRMKCPKRMRDLRPWRKKPPRHRSLGQAHRPRQVTYVYVGWSRNESKEGFLCWGSREDSAGFELSFWLRNYIFFDICQPLEDGLRKCPPKRRIPMNLWIEILE